jgi:Protein of unknown function (DUF3108)
MPLDHRRARRCSTGLGVVLMLGSTAVSAAEPWPARVAAVYEVEFAGVSIGTFDFNSTSGGGNYSLNGAGKLTLLFGALKWTGDAEASGRVAADGTYPKAFAYTWKGTSKSGSTRMTITGDTVSSVRHEPDKGPKEGTVPVLPAHLVGVLDPMSAVVAMSKGTSGQPCARRIPVYDGRARFDLVLTSRGTTPIAEQRPSGQPATGYVCRVKYVPISGHKPDEESKALATSTEIEVVLRPIPSANVFVPVKISVPTVAGSVVLKAKRVDITTSTQQIALTH